MSRSKHPWLGFKVKQFSNFNQFMPWWSLHVFDVEMNLSESFVSDMFSASEVDDKIVR